MKPILLVEPVAYYARKLITGFEKAGYTVCHAHDGPAALELIRQQPTGYLFVCCICAGPRFDAFDFIRTARQIPDAQNLSLLLLTFCPNESKTYDAWRAKTVRHTVFDAGLSVCVVREDKNKFMINDILAAAKDLLAQKKTEFQP